MKFITVRDLRTSPDQIWKDLPEEQEMVITNNGKPIALLTPLNNANLEETVKAVRRAKAINSIRKMQEISIKKGNNALTNEDIENEGIFITSNPINSRMIDENDKMFVEVSESWNAIYIITGNKKHNPRIKNVVTPSVFIDIYESK